MSRFPTLLSMGTLLVVTLALMSAALAQQLEPAPEREPLFSYAAKFVCGVDPPPAILRVVPGQYATAVAIHNPGLRDVRFRKKLALTFPPTIQEAGPVSEFIEDTLEPNTALQVDCEEIPAEFFPMDGFPTYIQGFLVIESHGPLDVAATYTAGEVDADGNVTVRSIDVEQIRERVIRRSRDEDPR